MKGYQRSAQHFMFAHGINFFSYENSEIMIQIEKNVAKLLTQIRFNKMITNDFKNFKELSSIDNIRYDLKKEDFEVAFKKLVKYLDSVSSYVGVLDKRFPIHILTQKKIIPKKPSEIKLEFMQKNTFVLKTISKRQIGQFSLTKTFVDDYVGMAKRYKTLDNIFRQIDVIIPTKDNLLVTSLKINDQSRSIIVEFFTKLRIDITQLPVQDQSEIS
jgi:hypothetical protein